MSDTDLLSVSNSPREATSPSGPSQARPVLVEPVTVSAPRSSEEVALVEIAIPVYNEQEVLESNVRRLRSYLDRCFPFSTSIVIVDNASVDGTWEVATRLCEELSGVGAIHLDQKGRGRAIRTAWTASRSEVVAYMDVDLSTDLDGLLPLVAPLLSGHSQVAIGSRIASGSRVLRGAKREFISRTYNLILRSALRCQFSDAQCGFKAMRRDAVEPLMDMVEDQAWFFDTELLIQAEWNGLRIHEVSVDWVDDPDTRVHIASTAREDLRGVLRLARQRQEGGGFGPLSRSDTEESFEYHRQMARYASVGILSTGAYLILFFFLRQPLGIFAANLVAAASTAAVNTFAHAGYTFRTHRAGQVRQAVMVGAFSFAVGVGLTTLALTAAYTIGRTSSTAEGIAILAGMLVASVVRFVLLREWAYRNHTRALLSKVGATREPFGQGDARQSAA